MVAAKTGLHANSPQKTAANLRLPLPVERW
jgi:hypothetical protein